MLLASKLLAIFQLVLISNVICYISIGPWSSSEQDEGTSSSSSSSFGLMAAVPAASFAAGSPSIDLLNSAARAVDPAGAKIGIL